LKKADQPGKKKRKRKETRKDWGESQKFFKKFEKNTLSKKKVDDRAWHLYRSRGLRDRKGEKEKGFPRLGLTGNTDTRFL